MRIMSNRNTAVLALLGLMLGGQVLAGDPIDVADRKQLFLDDFFTASSKRVKLAVNPPKKTGEKLIMAEYAWEPKYGCFSSMLQDDDGMLKIWYEGYDCVFDRSRDAIRYCLATSRDGIHWTKPQLGIHEFEGSKQNNIVMVGTGYAKKTRLIGGSVFKDPKAPPTMRYRFPYLKLNGYVSPDGVHWRATPTSKGSVQHCSGDTQAVAHWDENIGRYVYYTRKNTWSGGGDPKRFRKYAWSVRWKGDQVLRRHVTRAESDDFVTWTEPRDVLIPDDKDKAHGGDFYTSNVLKYPLADRAYILMTSYFHYITNSLDVELAVSRDGIRFTRPSRDKPFIPNGPKGSFDSVQIFVTHGFVRMGDEIWIYYGGCDKGHGKNWEKESKKGHIISRAILRLDGYMSVDAGPAGGVLTTKPIKFSGSRLELNVKTAKAGAVQVELLDATARRVLGRGEPFSGDSVKAVVKWKDGFDVGRFAGKPVALRFKMRDAKLYAFQFAVGKAAGRARPDRLSRAPRRSNRITEDRREQRKEDGG